MGERPILLAVSYGHTESVKNSGGELWNFYAEAAPEDAKARVTIVGHPGAVTFCTLGSTPGHALDAVVVNDKLYVWTTTGLYKVYADGTSRKLGTATLQAPARCETNGTDIVCVDGIKGFKYEIDPGEDAGPGNAVSEITDPEFFRASNVASIDTYLVFPRDGTSQFFNTELNSTNFDGADIRSAEGSPDKVVSLIARTQELWVLGTRSYEVFYDAGATLGSPFANISGAYGDIGVSSPWSLAKADKCLLWHSNTGRVYQAFGVAAEEISTPAMLEAFAGQDITTADAFVWKHGVHEFYQLTIGTVTMIFDITTGLWHRGGTSGASHPALRGIFCYGKQLMWNRTSNLILRVSQDLYDWNGADLTGQIISAPLHADQQNIPHSALEVELDMGEGLAATPLVEATMQLEYSDDGGRTWKNPQSRGMGLNGQYRKRMKWNALGAARDRRYRLTTSAKVARRVVSRAVLTV